MLFCYFSSLRLHQLLSNPYLLKPTPRLRPAVRLMQLLHPVARTFSGTRTRASLYPRPPVTPAARSWTNQTWTCLKTTRALCAPGGPWELLVISTADGPQPPRQMILTWASMRLSWTIGTLSIVLTPRQSRGWKKHPLLATIVTVLRNSAPLLQALWILLCGDLPACWGNHPWLHRKCYRRLGVVMHLGKQMWSIILLKCSHCLQKLEHLPQLNLSQVIHLGSL